MATSRIAISKLLHREWGRVTERVSIDREGIVTLRDTEKPVLCWPQFVPNDIVESIDGSEVYCIYEYLTEYRQINPATKKQVELGRVVALTIYDRDIEQCEIMDKAILAALNATRRVIDYSMSHGAPDQMFDLRGIRREITILY